MQKHKPRKTRKQRRAVAPTMIALFLNPDLGIQERAAVIAIRQGYATTDHFNVLADTRDMLMLAAKEKNNQSVINACEIAYDALMNIKERHQKINRIGASGDEIQALQLLVDTSEDFWTRQPGSLFIDAENALHRARRMRATEASLN